MKAVGSACFIALTGCLLGWTLPQPALAFGLRYSPVPLPTEYWTPCPAAKGKVECELIEAPTEGPTVEGYEGTGEGEGMDPADLRSAYDLPEKGGSGRTVAVVDLYNDPYAASDLANYRKRYELPECTEAGPTHCFRKINAKGEEANYPENNASSSHETSLDLDMVSAACGECHIVLVEAANSERNSMLAAEEEAVKEAEKLGSTAISNSWNFGFESEVGETETTYDHYFDHPGIPIFFAAGDYGYGVRYPAVSQYVIAVGGTELRREPESPRGWVEEPWFNAERAEGEKGRGTGSGCSKYEPKPKWQVDTSCATRIQNDVAADAGGATSPLSIYDSYEDKGKPWLDSDGTSAAAPFVAGVDALSTSYMFSLGAEAFYIDPAQLFDVTKGSDGKCTPPSEDKYFCTATVGYDGPTGNGTPDGALACPGTPCDVTTGSASGIIDVEATLTGSLNPNGQKTTYYFEYGKTAAYGTTVPTGGASAGSGTATVEKSRAITGLEPETLYHYRLVAENPSGAVTGGDRTFTTPGPSWSIETTPTTESSSNRLDRVSCTSATNCTAVGSYVVLGTRVTLAEHWNGKEWAIQSTPNPTGALESRLEGVSCTSSKACMATGEYENSEGSTLSLAESWEGTKWTILATPSPSGSKSSVLHVPSCSAGNACIAVGQYTNSGGTKLALAESWNGTEWTAQTPPNLSGAAESLLKGVSCTSTKACTAVGRYKNSEGALLTLAERWNGKEWTIQSTPNPSGAHENELLGVSCGSATGCTAVGTYENTGTKLGKSLAESWNGTEWTLLLTPSPPEGEGSILDGVSCPLSSACTAVGWYKGKRGTLTLAEHWTGSEWQIQTMPALPYETFKAELGGISCLSAIACTAVGLFSHEGSGEFTLAEGFS